MTDRFTTMLRRRLHINWEKDKGPLDMRYHSAGIGGIHSMPPPKPVVEGMALLKPRLIRIFLQEFFYIYPEHGVYDWTKMDAYMDAVHAMGGDIMASICIKPKPLYPVVDEKIWMPNDIKEWQEVIKALVLRYSKEKPYVTHWAIANEQNIGEQGGCPYLITDPDEYYEYYKFTAAPIREVLPPDIKVGGPSYAGAWHSAAAYLGRFVELCKRDNIPVDFVCYNTYNDGPQHHVSGGRDIRNALDKINPAVKLYMTEFNMALIGLGEEFSLEEKAFAPKRAAGQAAAILAFHEDGTLDGSFQYHIYDQMNDPREFKPFFASYRYMAEHWNDIPHRYGLFDLDGKARPQYFMYKLLYELTGQRVDMEGTDRVLSGLASRNDEGTLSIFLTNYAEIGTPDAVTRIFFKNAPEGMYRLNVYKIDQVTAARMKEAPLKDLPAAESRLVYAYPDFHFELFTPADSVTLVQLVKAE